MHVLLVDELDGVVQNGFDHAVALLCVVMNCKFNINCEKTDKESILRRMRHMLGSVFR